MAKRHAGLALIALVMAAAYLPSINGPFLLDDIDLLGDPRVRDPLGQPLSAWLDWNRPVAMLTFAADHAVAGWIRARGT